MLNTVMSESCILIFENEYSISNYLLKTWTTLALQAISSRGSFTAALSGGRAPAEFYARLAGVRDTELWRHTDIFQVDERFVPEDHFDNNARFIRSTLLSDVPIPPKQFHTINTHVSDSWQSAEEYEKEIINFFQLEGLQLPTFDLVLLGIGEDGHTASLFPGTHYLKEKSRLVTSLSTPRIKHERISLTLPAINAGKKIIMLAIGERKADIMHRLIDQHEDLPANAVNPTGGELVIVLDHWAARKISVQEFEHDGDAVRINLTKR